LSGQRFEFNPKEYAIIKKYSEKLKLFEDLLSPTLVTLVSCVETNKSIIKKSILKNKLLSDQVRDSARRE